jgi:hypothetical protein
MLALCSAWGKPMKPNQFVQKAFNRVVADTKSIIEEGKYQKIASNNYDLQGYKRVYLVHIRKTGGTSLNNMFLSLSKEEPTHLYSKLANTPSHRLISNGLIYVGWNVRLINKGNYFYAFSHTPLHQLNLPDSTFTVSCFRDPVKRVLSHYNMLMDYRVNKIDNPCMATEGKWLGEHFDDFLQRIPKEHLLNQLYMFSNSYKIKEAVSNVQSLSHYFFSETFDAGIDDLNKKTGLNLESVHIRKAGYKAEISENSLAKLRELLDEEYKFLSVIQGLQAA